VILARDTIRGIGKFAGAVASIGALSIFIYSFANAVSFDDATHVFYTNWKQSLLAIAIYGLAFIPMTWAWIILARGCGALADRKALARVFLISQLGKYLPGNIGHLIGRAYLGRREGLSFGTMMMAMILEVSGVLLAGSMLAGVAAGLGSIKYGGLTLSLASGTIAVASLLGALLLLNRHKELVRRLAKPILLALACYLVVFALLITMNVILLGTIANNWVWSDLIKVAGAVVVSWLIGFVTPGAPAGIGLRELSFFSLLGGVYPDQAVILAAAASRIVTMLGDGIACLTGLAMKRHGKGPQLSTPSHYTIR